MAHASDGAGWSTSELARIARTTVKAIRHYHAAGLLPEPERASNGYKSYGPEELRRLLHVLAMREMGCSVAQIAESLRAGGPSRLDAERMLAQVDASIRRLQATRRELLATVERSAAAGADAPEGADAPVSAVQDAWAAGHEASLARGVMARHLAPEAMAAVRAMDAGEATSVDAEFERLPADACEQDVDDLATRMAPLLRATRAEHPMPGVVVEGDGSAERHAASAVGAALAATYSAAQLEVVRRAVELGAASCGRIDDDGRG